MSEVQKHFNDIAEEYDYWKKRNAYYYDHLKRLMGSLIPPQQKVWEIGCGTGDILVSLDPIKGWGVDISEKMIERARIKHYLPSIQFDFVNINDLNSVQDYDFIVLVDVMEHIPQSEEFLKKIKSLTKPGAKIVITVANPLWEPILMLAEKMKLKMPEGPHQRISIRKTESLFSAAGFTISKKGRYLLVPKRLPGAEFINSFFSNMPVVNHFNFIVYWVLE